MEDDFEMCQEDKWFEQAFTYMSQNAIPLPNDKKLHFYGLFKQATVGDCNIDKPGLFDFVARAKYDAWQSFKGLSFREARNQYIDSVESLNVGWSRQGEYEYVPSAEELKEAEGISNVSVSCMATEKEEEETQDVFGYTRLYDLEKLAEVIKSNPQVINTKQDGLSPLHIAADRGYTDALKLLVEAGADINLKTDDEDTALHLACIAEHLDAAQFLVSKGCDTTLLDSEGKTAFEQADTSFTEKIV
ncbi:acyl-CoA-binding protein [Choanephora cucurbitarum]|nr:acyl-CoA-binding protein [Choanephora cucurbitarum]